MVRPIFVDGELVAFAAAKGHWTEVGGKDPGSWTADSVEIFQEGLQLPFVRVARGGELDRDLVAMIGANSRLPDMTIGDLTAFAACLEVAERRVLELCRRYGVDDVTAAMAAAHERSEALARAAVARLPRGVFEAEDFIDEDGLGNGPFRIRVRVEIDGERVVADFTGTHPQVPGPVNCTRSGLVSGVRTVFKAMTDPNEPGSDAWFRPFEVICPLGTIFTAERPAPVSLYFEATEAATDLLWKALAPAMPEVLTAGSFVSVCATAIACTHPDTGEPTLLVEPQAGGWGASILKDGEHGLVSVGDGETYVIPAEVCEQRYGIRVERFGFDVVEAGAGRRRGGRGLVREYRMLTDGSLTVGFGRHRYPPWGVDGGHDGSPNYVEVVRRDGDARAVRQGRALPAPRGRPRPAGHRDRRRRRRSARARTRARARGPRGWPRDRTRGARGVRPRRLLSTIRAMQLDASTLPALARGCAILGAGGGGDTEIGLLASLQAVEDHGPVPLVDLDELPDEALLMPCGGIGAPTVSIEKIESGDEGGRLREMVETLWNRPVVALMSAEIGGSNGVIPIVWAARLGLPVVDADGMGRAFPEVQQVTMEIAGISPNPAVMTDERGNVDRLPGHRRRLDGADGARGRGRVRRHGVVERVPADRRAGQGAARS